MCGINGFTFKDKILIKKMNAKIIHRGNDDTGIFLDNSVSLGHQRLSILDLSSLGHQPMVSEDEMLIIVYNGEIYNYLTLRENLLKRGYKFKSNTDTEVILYSYKEWKEKCVEKFNGMWAFCIYDKKSNRLFLSRDRFGIKPLYYCMLGSDLIFSSEIKAILECPQYERSINERILFDYLQMGLVEHSEETFFSDIYKIPPAHYAYFDLSTKKITKSRYWQIDITPQTHDKFKDRKEKIKNFFMKSVNMHLLSDVPVGSCLSGGIDSSAIVCAMNKSSNYSFSAVYKGKKIDESKFINIVQKATNIEAKTISPTANDLLADIDDLIYYQEEPFSTTSIYAQYCVMKLAKENNIFVLLDGQGADELFAGYRSYYFVYLNDLLQHKKFALFLKEIFMFYKIHRKFKPIFLAIIENIPAVRKIYQKKKETNSIQFLNETFKKRFEGKRVNYGFSKGLKNALYKRFTIGLPALLRYEDKNSMRWTIESRVPYLEKDLVEYIFSCPSKDLIKNGITKYIFREAMNGVLPEEIRTRNDKIGFETPQNDWLKDAKVVNFIDELLTKDAKILKYVDIEKIFLFWNMHKHGEINIGSILWRLICAEKWMQIYF